MKSLERIFRQTGKVRTYGTIYEQLLSIYILSRPKTPSSYRVSIELSLIKSYHHYVSLGNAKFKIGEEQF